MTRPDLEVRLLSVVFLLSLSFLLLLGARDHRGVERMDGSSTACVASMVRGGAPYTVAVGNCSRVTGLTFREVEEDLP